MTHPFRVVSHRCMRVRKRDIQEERGALLCAPGAVSSKDLFCARNVMRVEGVWVERGIDNLFTARPVRQCSINRRLVHISGVYETSASEEPQKSERAR